MNLHAELHVNQLSASRYMQLNIYTLVFNKPHVCCLDPLLLVFLSMCLGGISERQVHGAREICPETLGRPLYALETLAHSTVGRRLHANLAGRIPRQHLAHNGRHLLGSSDLDAVRFFEKLGARDGRLALLDDSAHKTLGVQLAGRRALELLEQIHPVVVPVDDLRLDLVRAERRDRVAVANALRGHEEHALVLHDFMQHSIDAATTRHEEKSS